MIVKKYKTCTVFLSSYRNTSGSLGELETLEMSETFTSASITRYKHGEHVFYLFLENTATKKTKTTC